MLTYVLLGTNDLDRATRFYDATLTLLGSAASPATRMGSPRQAGEPMRMMARANWRSGSESHSMHGIRADLNRGTGPGRGRVKSAVAVDSGDTESRLVGADRRSGFFAR
jgi:hypothetical protein